jgi:hypothetical protein
VLSPALSAPKNRRWASASLYESTGWRLLIGFRKPLRSPCFRILIRFLQLNQLDSISNGD